MKPNKLQVIQELYGLGAVQRGDNTPEIVNEDGSTRAMTSEEASAVDARYAELVAEYDALEYQRLRAVEYAKLNQFELQFDDSQDGGTRWADAINAIKELFPKP